MAILERTYIIPLRRGFWKTPRHKRANKAVKVLREFLTRHMKADAKEVKLGQHLNHYLWQDGIRNPPHKVKVLVKKMEDGNVQAELFGNEYASIAPPKDVQEQATGLKGKLQAAMGKGDEPEADAKKVDKPKEEAPKEKEPEPVKPANSKE